MPVVKATLFALALWGAHATLVHALLWFGCAQGVGDTVLRAAVLGAGALAVLALARLALRERRGRLPCAIALAGVAWASLAPVLLPACTIVH